MVRTEAGEAGRQTHEVRGSEAAVQSIPPITTQVEDTESDAFANLVQEASGGAAGTSDGRRLTLIIVYQDPLHGRASDLHLRDG